MTGMQAVINAARSVVVDADVTGVGPSATNTVVSVASIERLRTALAVFDANDRRKK